jgi:DNA-binding GntR family transcriptional regulator
VERLKAVDATTLQEKVYEQLRHGLMSGAFKPGESVTLRGIAEATGTSLMPVREAVRRLVSIRALEMPNSRSTRVPLLVVEDFDELVAVRLLLEPEATALAAANVTPESLAQLRSLDATVRANFEAGDLEGFLVANRGFHAAIYALSGNTRLVALIDSLWLQSGPYLTLVQHGMRTALSARIDDHADILNALQRRDPEKARQAMTKLLKSSAQIYRDLIKSSRRK